MEALFCVVFAVATAVGYSKGQTSNLGHNASIDVLRLSPNDIVRFSLLLFARRLNSPHSSSPLRPLLPSLIKSPFISFRHPSTFQSNIRSAIVLQII